MADIIIIRTGYQSIKTDYFRQSTLDKGIKLHKSGHVFNVEEKQFCDKSLISGYVIRATTINSPPYKVEIEVSKICLF